MKRQNNLAKKKKEGKINLIERRSKAAKFCVGCNSDSLPTVAIDNSSLESLLKPLF